jgi:hypothetical protein
MAIGVTFAACRIVAAAIGTTPIEKVQVPSSPDGAAGGATIARAASAFALQAVAAARNSNSGVTLSISVHAALKCLRIDCALRFLSGRGEAPDVKEKQGLDLVRRGAAPSSSFCSRPRGRVHRRARTNSLSKKRRETRAM